MEIATEHRHYCIADKLIYITPLRQDLLYHYIKIIVEEFYNNISRLIFTDGSKAADINKHHRILHCFILDQGGLKLATTHKIEHRLIQERHHGERSHSNILSAVAAPDRLLFGGSQTGTNVFAEGFRIVNPLAVCAQADDHRQGLLKDRG